MTADPAAEAGSSTAAMPQCGVVLLISTYDLGRQPFGLASAAAAVRAAGHEVVCADLAKEPLSEATVRRAALIAFFVPMHTATRLAIPVIDRVRAANPGARLIAYGLYAPLNAPLLRDHGVSSIIGGEFEDALVASVSNKDALVASVSNKDALVASVERPPVTGASDERARVPRVHFLVPDRAGLPPLTRYATLQWGDERRTAGYTEASRGCKHRCRHCPIVPVYDGRFRVVPVDIVMADVRAQVAAGAQHITFGDPDFLNGIGHATAVVDRFAREFPGVSYDVTIKVEHLLRHADVLPRLRDTRCAFITTAVESVDDRVLALLDKGHTRADFERLVERARAVPVVLAPTFVAFTPWTTLEGYCDLLRAIDRLDLTDHVAPIQLAIRLLVTEGSRLLEIPEIRRVTPQFSPRSLTYPWVHPDPRVDDLQQAIEALVGVSLSAPRRAVFGRVWTLAHDAAGIRAERYDPAIPARATIPYLNEPWYC
jgi:radical SAM superfamily enzyme YgiQ (UPF0313 family)